MKIKDLFKCFDFGRFNENHESSVIDVYLKEEDGVYSRTESIDNLDDLDEFLDSNSETEVDNWYFCCEYCEDIARLEIFI